MSTEYRIFRHFIFITEEVPLSQEGIHFTGSKQIGKDSIWPELRDTFLFNGCLRVVKLVVVINHVTVDKVVPK